MTRLTQTTLLMTGLFVVTLFAGGCASTITSADLRSDPNPELYSVSRTEEHYYNYRALVRDNTWRQFHDDWATIWLENRNLRLTRYTLP